MTAAVMPRRRDGLAWLRNTPLMLCYVAFPLSNQVAVAIAMPLYRNWIDMAWVLVVAAVVALRPRRRADRPGSISRPLSLAFCGLAIALAIAGYASGQTPLVTATMELKPVFYALIALVLLSRIHAPNPEAFCRYGAVLATVLLIEALVRSAAAGTVERPLGSGEVNYDAALLCLSLVFAAADHRLARRYGWIIWIGIIASFSRTGLLAACLVLLFSSAISLRLRLLMSVLAIGAVLASFAIRDLEVGNVESLDRYWMWATGLEYILSNPLGSALVAAPGQAVDVDAPVFIAELWANQQDNLTLDGVYPFHFHAMWLRLAIAWGWLPLTVAAVMFIRQFFTTPRRPPQSRPFFVVCAVLGLTMGLLYLGNVAIVVLAAGSRVLRLRGRRSRQRRLAMSARAHSHTTAALGGTSAGLVIATGQ